MYRRILLALTFAAVFSCSGLGPLTYAQPWRGDWGYGRPYRSYYYAPRSAYYGPVVPYRAYYGPRYVRPYSTYYAYPAYPDYGYYDYYGPRNEFSVSFGF